VRTRPSIFDSFNFAFEGIIHVLRTQRNMRIHFAVAAAVLVGAIATGVERLELIALLLAVSFVLITEMINTAIEASIDVSRSPSSPRTSLREPS
jgi:diacylglycerol kinase (ATP)